MASRIFLAHAREDKVQVRQLYADLKARGFDPWLDEVDLFPGQIWKQEIPNAIRQAGVFLACLSSRSVGKVGYVQNEFRLALAAFAERPSGSIFLIPVRLDDCEVPDLQLPDRGLSLRDIQWVDLWQEGGLDQLTSAIERALQEEAPVLRRPAEAMAVRSGVAPDQAPDHIAPSERDVADFLSQEVNHQTLPNFLVWKYPSLRSVPSDKTIQQQVITDLSGTGVTTLYGLDQAVNDAAEAVECYRRENPDVFKAAIDFLSKSLGFTNKQFREKHSFSARTRAAFAKYGHLVHSHEAHTPTQKQETTVHRDVKPTKTEKISFWRHPTVVAAVIAAIATVAAALLSSPQLSGWLVSLVNGPLARRDGQEGTEKRDDTLADPSTTTENGTFRDCSVCPEMVAVSEGSFLMGSPEGEGSDDEEPRHQVSIPEPFAAGKYEVTFDEWEACVAAGDCNYRPYDERWGRGRRPVINVTWHDAQAYVAWLREETGKPYRLLSEAEWEYAARAGTTTRYPWGDEIAPKNANYNQNVGKTTEVGSYPSNPWGLYDMQGNVWEWVEDCWNESYQGAPSDGSAWTRGDCTRRVLRGGSWLRIPRDLRSARRVGEYSDLRYYAFGFRVARTLSRSES